MGLDNSHINTINIDYIYKQIVIITCSLKRRRVRKITSKLKKQKLQDIFVELCRLEASLNSNDSSSHNYIIIRLVTIIEQFFRKIIEIQLEKGGQFNIPDEIISKSSDNYKLGSMPTSIVISSSFNFQNIETINEGMKVICVSNEFQDAIKHYKNDLENLFDLRHDTVHTVIPASYDRVFYYKIVEKLLKDMLNIIDCDYYFYSTKGDAYYTLNKFDQAIPCYDKAIELDPNNPII